MTLEPRPGERQDAVAGTWIAARWRVRHLPPREIQMISRLIAVCSIGCLPLLGGAAATVALGQTISMDIVIDHHVPPGEPLEKAVDYFTSRDLPSVVVGNG